MNLIKKYWFLLGIVLVFAIVIADSTLITSKTGIFIKNLYGPQIAIVLVFIFSGIIIDYKDIIAGFQDIKGLFAALFLIFICAPLIAFLFSKTGLSTGILIGIFLVSAMPSTLSSGVVMTGSAGGNMAHSLMITISSNFIAVLTIPFTLVFLLGSAGELKNIDIDKTAIIIKLLSLVLLPLLMGMFLKWFLKIKPALKGKFQILNQICILIIVFMALSDARKTIMDSGSEIFLIFALVFLFHGILLLFGFIVIKFMKIKKGKYESVLFMGCQKTLPLSLILQVSLFPTFGTALVVCVTHHIIHLLMDSYVVGYLNKEK